jgi:competence protein ComEC
MKGIVAAAVALLAGCPPPAGPTTPSPTPPQAPPGDGQAQLPPPAQPPPTITHERVLTAEDIPLGAPSPGTWRLHMLDVGTGLSILIQGADFTLLFDAGTNDKGERPARILDYLARAIGPCKATAIHHVVLSHPHLDHASALSDVLHCYAVANLWDSGAVNDTAFYHEVMEAVAASTALAYHTAAPPPADRTIEFKKKGAVSIPPSVDWKTFSEGDVVELGAGASFALLHAEGKQHSDMNQNSIVIAVSLGGATVLLVGDAESGERADPSMPAGDVEQHLIEHFAKEIDADILQVGHHGSKTSSRSEFLRAVSPKYALVSVGPKAYGKVVLPDAEVIEALEAVGAIIVRTDEHDAECPGGPGGCDHTIFTIEQPAR